MAPSRPGRDKFRDAATNGEASRAQARPLQWEGGAEEDTLEAVAPGTACRAPTGGASFYKGKDGAEEGRHDKARSRPGRDKCPRRYRSGREAKGKMAR